MKCTGISEEADPGRKDFGITRGAWSWTVSEVLSKNLPGGLLEGGKVNAHRGRGGYMSGEGGWGELRRRAWGLPEGGSH